MFVLELPAANRTFKGRILAALNSQVLLQRVSPQVSLAALEAPPQFLRVAALFSEKTEESDNR